MIDLENKSVGENIVDVIKQSYKKEMKGKDYGQDKDALVYLRKSIKKKIKFIHGETYSLPGNTTLTACYHPSPRNVNTKLISEKMIVSLFLKVKKNSIAN